VAPGPREALALPDLAKLNPDAAMPTGSMMVLATLAHIENFDYGSLRYRQLAARGWNAYAGDSIFTEH
jgi:hypothetical protein